MNLKDIFAIPIYGHIHVGTIVFFATKGVIIYLFTATLAWTIRKMFGHSMKKQDPSNRTNSVFIQHILVWIVYLIGTTAFLSMVPGMKRIADSILASAGILAMAVGLASKEALSNLVGGFFIIIGKPFRVGDIISVGHDVFGKVIEINLRHTVIRNFENKMIIVPNSTMNSATIINSTIGDETNCVNIDICVSYDTQLDRAIEIMRDEIMKHPLLLDHRTKKDLSDGTPEVVVRVLELGNSAITLRAYAWASDFNKAFVLKCDLLKSIKERFESEKIEIPYPYQNVIMRQ